MVWWSIIFHLWTVVISFYICALASVIVEYANSTKSIPWVSTLEPPFPDNSRLLFSLFTGSSSFHYLCWFSQAPLIIITASDSLLFFPLARSFCKFVCQRQNAVMVDVVYALFRALCNCIWSFWCALDQPVLVMIFFQYIEMVMLWATSLLLSFCSLESLEK